MCVKMMCDTRVVQRKVNVCATVNHTAVDTCVNTCLRRQGFPKTFFSYSQSARAALGNRMERSLHGACCACDVCRTRLCPNRVVVEKRG